MKIKFWGTRGSLPSSGPETQVFGGNTPCVSISSGPDLLILDAGSGIRRLGKSLNGQYSKVNILLTHLHMDHIQGMGFFDPIYDPDFEIHIWGPASTGSRLIDRLNRYLSPPLFPVGVRELPSQLHFHEVPCETFQIGNLSIEAQYVCHPGPTVGYRLQEGDHVVAYIPDHEPALGAREFPTDRKWISGFDLAWKADILIHDAQFTAEEYAERIGWGHSSYEHAIRFAEQTQVRHLVFFHHDPGRNDVDLARYFARKIKNKTYPFRISVGKEGEEMEL